MVPVEELGGEENAVGGWKDLLDRENSMCRHAKASPCMMRSENN